MKNVGTRQWRIDIGIPDAQILVEVLPPNTPEEHWGASIYYSARTGAGVEARILDTIKGIDELGGVRGEAAARLAAFRLIQDWLGRIMEAAADILPRKYAPTDGPTRP